MKKKIATLILTAAMAASFAGCGNNAPAVQTSESTPAVESSAEEPSASEATAAPETKESPAATKEPASSPEATAEPTVAPTEAPTAETSVAATPAPTEEPKATYTYTDKSATMYAKSSVNVRNLPSTDGEKVGALNTNDAVTVTGVCNETGWYRFELNGQEAYVSGNYLQASKVQVASNANTNTQGAANGTGTGTGTTVANGTTVAGNGTTAASGTAESGTSDASNSGSGVSTDNMVWDGGEIKGYEQADGSVTIVDKGGNVVEENAEILDDWGLEGASPHDEELFNQVQDMIDQQVNGTQP